MKIRRGRWIGLMVVVLLVGSWNILWAEQDTLKVGLLVPVTGKSPDWGKKQVIGMEMAVEMINRRGGVNGTPVEVIQYDTGGGPAQAVEAYQKLSQADKVLVVVGPLFSGTFKGLLPVTNEEKVALVATASAKPGLSDLKRYPYAFRMTVTSEKKEGPQAKAWVDANQVKNVAIVYDKKDLFTVGLGKKLWPKIFKGLGVNVVNLADPITFETGDTDFASQVKQLKSLNPDGICISAFPVETGEIIKEIRNQGLKQPLLGGSATSTPRVVEIAGDDAEGLWAVSLFYLDDPSPKVQKYAKAFRKRCQQRYPDMGCDPEQFDVVVYDIFQFLVDIMRKQGISGASGSLQQERTKIRDGMANMRPWRGTGGLMGFDKKGDGNRTIHILQVKDGKWQPAY